MSDEAAFLDALKANPADDTARLVYADWLDEHNEPQKAEYLRLVAAFAQRGNNLAPLAGAKEFVGLAATLPDDWRVAAGSRFALLLERYLDKIKAIKWIRECTGDGLGEAKSASESLPHAVFDAAPFEVAYAAYERVNDGGFASVRITPDLLDVPLGARFHLVIRATVFGGSGVAARATAARAALAAILVTALGITEEEANERANVDSDTVLVPDLTLREARSRRALLQRLLPPYDPQQGWWLWLDRWAIAQAASH